MARLQEDYDAATALLHEGLDLARASQHTFVTAATLHHLAMIAADAEANYPSAHSLLQESLTLYRQLGAPRFTALVLLTLGEIARAQANYTQAREALHEALTTMSNSGERLGIHGALDALAHLAFSEGQTKRAVRLAAGAAELRAETQTQSWPVIERQRRQWLNQARNTLGPTSYQTACNEGQTLTDEQAISYASHKSPHTRSTPQ